MNIKIDKRRIVLGIIILILFLLPFFWFNRNSYNIGGDDTRLYFVSPIDWLNNISKYSWFNGVAGGFGTYNPQHFYIPINIVSNLIKNTFFFINHQTVIYGLLLCFSFLTVYLIIFELLDRKKEWDYFWSSVIGGIFYVFIPIVFTFEWPNPTAGFLGIMAFPLLFLFFLRAIKRRKISELIWGGIIGVVFGISLRTVSNLLPFLVGFFIFFLLYFLIIELNKKIFIKYLFIYLFLIILLNSFWLIPFFNSSFQGDPQVSLSLSSTGKEEAVRVIEYFSTKTSLLHHLSGISGFGFINVKGFLGKVLEYSFKAIRLGILFFVIILFGFLVKSKNREKEKKILIISVITFLCIAFLITVNIGNLGIGLFTWLMRNIPGFVAIRNFWAKVAQSYGLFYSIALGMACYLIFSSIKRKTIKGILISFIFLIIFFQAIPFINGGIVNLPIRYSQEDAQLNRNVKLPLFYLEMASYLKNSTGDNRILSLPLIKGSWSIILSEEKKGVYIGSSPIKVFTGKDDFNSDLAFRSISMSELNGIVKSAFEDKDYFLLKNIFALLNIKYLVYDSQIYDEHQFDFDKIREEYIWIHKYGGEQRYQQLIDNLPVKLEKTFGQWQIYKFDDNYFLPHIYSAQKLNYIQGDFNSFGELISFGDYNLRDGILFINSAVENSFIKEKINDIFVPIKSNATKNEIKNIEEKIKTAKDIQQKNNYEVQLRLIRDYAFLDDNYSVYIPREDYYKIYIKKDSSLVSNENLIIKIDNQIIGFDKQEVAQENNWYILNPIKLNSGSHSFQIYNKDSRIYVVNLGDIVLRTFDSLKPINQPKIEFTKINPTKYKVKIKQASESFPLVFLESYHPEWKIYIDDENYKFFSKKPILEDKHFMVNSFANAWWIDINEIKNQKSKIKSYIENPDGSVDFSIIIEFEPQKYFYLGLGISGITFLGCFGYLGYDWRRKRKIRTIQSNNKQNGKQDFN